MSRPLNYTHRISSLTRFSFVCPPIFNDPKSPRYLSSCYRYCNFCCCCYLPIFLYHHRFMMIVV